MIKYNLTNSLIGNIYPFFLGNSKLTTSDASYYLYQVVSPKLSPDLIPYISLNKISEKTKIGAQGEFYGQGLDIISACLGNRDKVREKAVSYLKSILWRENPVIDRAEGDNFPLIEMENGNNIQKSIIIGLRDSIRWKNYKFQEGNYIDILWGPDTFMLFKIIGGEKGKSEIGIEPVGLYKNLDPEMKNPLPIDLSSVDYPLDRWSISEKNKASEMNRVIKKLEWESFNRRIRLISNNDIRKNATVNS